jgi:hypothetical protein
MKHERSIFDRQKSSAARLAAWDGRNIPVALNVPRVLPAQHQPTSALFKIHNAPKTDTPVPGKPAD